MNCCDLKNDLEDHKADDSHTKHYIVMIDRISTLITALRLVHWLLTFFDTTDGHNVLGSRVIATLRMMNLINAEATSTQHVITE